MPAGTEHDTHAALAQIALGLRDRVAAEVKERRHQHRVRADPAGALGGARRIPARGDRAARDAELLATAEPGTVVKAEVAPSCNTGSASTARAISFPWWPPPANAGSSSALMAEA